MSASEYLDQILRTVQREIADETMFFIRDLAEDVLREILATWPGQDRPSIHIYARDRSKRTWRLETTRDKIKIINTSGYSGYVEEGFTKQGQGTAGPWHIRGAEDYAMAALRRKLEERWPHYIERIKRIL